MKTVFVTFLFLAMVATVKSQSLSYHNLTALVGGSTAYCDYLLSSNGFAIADTKEVKGQKIRSYYKNMENTTSMEAVTIVMAPAGKANEKQQSAVLYTQKDARYMLDFAKAMSTQNYTLEKNTENKEGLYNYQSKDYSLQIMTTLNPIKKSYSILMTGKREQL